MRLLGRLIVLSGIASCWGFVGLPLYSRIRCVSRQCATVQPREQQATTTSASPTTPSEYWKNQWYPVAVASDTDKTKPYSFTLLGNNIVIWWDGLQWRAVDDTCPHRLAPLSEGRVADGQIECPYHGWRFQGNNGACTKIPQLEKPEDLKKFARSCAVGAYHVVEAQGLIFVHATRMSELQAPPDPADVPLSEPLKDPDVVCLSVSRDMPYDYATLLENILDPSHVPFTHHKTVGNREWAGPVPLKLVGPLTAKGYNGTWERMVPMGPMTRRDPSEVKRETVFNAPLYMHHLIDVPESTTWTVTYAVPMAPGKSRIIARFPFKFGKNDTTAVAEGADGKQKKKRQGGGGTKFSTRLIRLVFRRFPAWLQHVQQNTVLDDDNIFLHQQERRLSAMGGKWSSAYVMPTKADVFVSSFRKWLDLYGGGGPFGEASTSLEPLSFKTPEELLNRYDQHTRHCASCSGALRNIRKLKPAALSAAAVSGYLSLAIGGAVGRVALVALGALFVGAWKFMDGVEEGMMRGPYPPPRNRPEKVKTKGIEKGIESSADPESD